MDILTDLLWIAPLAVLTAFVADKVIRKLLKKKLM